MGIRRTFIIMGLIVGLSTAFTATPTWAGQVGLTAVTSFSTVTETTTGTFANTAFETFTSTTANTFADTSANTLALTTFDTVTGSNASTNADTIIKTTGNSTITQTLTGSIGGTQANTSASTLAATTLETVANTTLRTVSSTVMTTETGSFANTTTTTVQETILFTAQPADVSIEISQEGLNLTSPFANVLEASGLENNVAVTSSAGVTQVQANTGNANVSVASNAILQGSALIGVANNISSQVALKELSVLTLVPGFALQNSTKATTAHIAGLALAAAESAAIPAVTTSDDGTLATSVTDDVLTINTAVDIVHSDINEYSPHGNNTQIAGLVRNRVSATGTSGITQVQANAGGANVSGAHSVLLVNTP